MPSHVNPNLLINDEVAAALRENRPIVALESTIISHGLPRPRNLEMAREFEAQVRRHGAVPATIAMVGGKACIGLSDEQLQTIAFDESVVKVSVRELGTVAARGGHGATTVAATSHLAAQAGIKVFATGGLGGVHRDAKETWDESADLPTIATTPVTVVSAGVKSILDVPATLERLETLGIPVATYRTNHFPGFYLTDSGYLVEWAADSAAEIAAAMRQRELLGIHGGMVVANPLPLDQQLDPTLHEQLLRSGLAAANEQGVRGKAVTPFLLEFFHRESQGASLEVNVQVVLNNVALAAEIAANL